MAFDLLLDLGRGPEQMVVLGGVELLPRKNIHRIRKLLVEIFVQHIAGLIFQDVFIIKALSGSELQKQLLRVVREWMVDEARTRLWGGTIPQRDSSAPVRSARALLRERPFSGPVWRRN